MYQLQTSQIRIHTQEVFNSKDQLQANLEMVSSKLHVAMFPWCAFGHFIPFLHLANKFAERGHRVSYLLPKGVQPKLEQLNQHPHLIHFFPLVVPHVDGLPPGAETASDVPPSLHGLLGSAIDKTKDQVETILRSLKPEPQVVFYDHALWIPAITHELGGKSIYYGVVNACSLSLLMVPGRRMVQNKITLEELIKPPPGYPSPNVVIKQSEAPYIAFINDPVTAWSFCESVAAKMKESDAIAVRTCNEMEGPFCEYLAQQYAKPVLLTGPILPETSATELEEKWDKWLNKFEPGSVVYCALGSQITLEKKQFQELVLGFELSGLPFLVALTPPHGCSTIEEALPDGFKERVGERGWVYGGWVPQTQILEHPSVGCFVSHCGFGSMWESLLSDCQIVLIPLLPDQVMGTRIMVEELKVAVEVERGVDGNFAKESLSKAIKLVMDKESETGFSVKSNHIKWKKMFSSKHWQEGCIDSFLQHLQVILESRK